MRVSKNSLAAMPIFEPNAKGCPPVDTPPSFSARRLAVLDETRRWIREPLSPRQQASMEGLLGHRPEDAPLVEALFRKAIHYQQAGYVLCGAKALGLVEEMNFSFLDRQRPAEIRDNLRHHITAEEWQAWRRLSPLIISSRFVTSCSAEDVHGIANVIFCDMQTLAGEIDTNARLISARLGRVVDVAELRRCIERGKHPFDLLNRREDILGLLLGYGWENSVAFRRICELTEIENTPSGPVRRVRQDAQPSGGFLSALEEYTALNASLPLLQADLPELGPAAVYPMRFRGHPETTETMELLNFYRALQRELTTLVQDQLFLVRVLNRYACV